MSITYPLSYNTTITKRLFDHVFVYQYRSHAVTGVRIVVTVVAAHGKAMTYSKMMVTIDEALRVLCMAA